MNYSSKVPDQKNVHALQSSITFKRKDVPVTAVRGTDVKLGSVKFVILYTASTTLRALDLINSTLNCLD